MPGPIERALVRDLKSLPPSKRTSTLAVAARVAARHADDCDEKMFPAIIAQLRAALTDLHLLEAGQGKDWVDNIAGDLAERRARKAQEG